MEVDSPPVTQVVVLDFASYLFHEWILAPATISLPLLALSHPLEFGFGVVVELKMRDAQWRRFFNHCLPVCPRWPFWSLCRVMSRLQSPLFVATASLECIFYKAFFLVALATGLRASQLHT